MEERPKENWLRDLAIASKGNPDSFSVIVREFQDMAVGYAYSILRNFESAEDAAQEAFVEAYRTLRQLRQPKAFPGWFRRIVLKQCDRMMRRRSVLTLSLDEARGLSDKGFGPAEACEQEEIRERVSEVIDALPNEEREVTSLFYMSGHSAKEVSEFLEIPLSTVRGRLHAARIKLRERMMSMVEKNLKAKRPSRDEKFADRVARMYTDLTESELFKWQLGYMMSPLVDEFLQTPDEKIHMRAAPGNLSPAWIIGHMATKERFQMRMGFHLDDDTPPSLRRCANLWPADDELKALGADGFGKWELVDYWIQVRLGTIACLNSVSDTEMKRIYSPKCAMCAEHKAKCSPPPPHYCNQDPLREVFVQTIWYQSYWLGALMAQRGRLPHEIRWAAAHDLLAQRLAEKFPEENTALTDSDRLAF